MLTCVLFLLRVCALETLGGYKGLDLGVVFVANQLGFVALVGLI